MSHLPKIDSVNTHILYSLFMVRFLEFNKERKEKKCYI